MLEFDFSLALCCVKKKRAKLLGVFVCACCVVCVVCVTS